jgi:hypothetical protein
LRAGGTIGARRAGRLDRLRQYVFDAALPLDRFGYGRGVRAGDRRAVAMECRRYRRDRRRPALGAVRKGAPVSIARRLDQLVLNCAEHVVKTAIEPRLSNLPLWDGGGGELVAEYVKLAGVPSKPLTVVDMARLAGILPASENGDAS